MPRDQEIILPVASLVACLICSTSIFDSSSWALTSANSSDNWWAFCCDSCKINSRHIWPRISILWSAASAQPKAHGLLDSAFLQRYNRKRVLSIPRSLQALGVSLKGYCTLRFPTLQPEVSSDVFPINVTPQINRSNTIF